MRGLSPDGSGHSSHLTSSRALRVGGRRLLGAQGIREDNLTAPSKLLLPKLLSTAFQVEASGLKPLTDSKLHPPQEACSMP